MPSGRGPWTVSNDGGIPVGAIVVAVIFGWAMVVVAAFISRNAAWIYAGIGLTASAAAGVFAGVRRHERYLQTWRGESEVLFGLMRRRKPVRDRQIETLPVTVSISPVAAPAAIEASKTIQGHVEREVPVWTAR